MKKLIVDQTFQNKKLSRFLMHKILNIDLNLVYKLLRKKDIKINGKRINQNIPLNVGDVVEVYIKEEDIAPTFLQTIPVVYEDENIIVVNKPSDLEVVGFSSLTSILQKQYPNLEKDFPSACHRIDRNTSGLVLFAKNKMSFDILLNKFKQNEIKKKYITKIYGIPKKDHDILEAYLFKDQKKKMVYIYDTFKPGSKKIKTEYTVIEKQENKNSSILEVILHTGKTHQIRAHLSYIGHPIIGDRKIWNW